MAEEKNPLWRQRRRFIRSSPMSWDRICGNQCQVQRSSSCSIGACPPWGRLLIPVIPRQRNGYFSDVKNFNNFEEYFCVWTLAIMTIVVFAAGCDAPQVLQTVSLVDRSRPSLHIYGSLGWRQLRRKRALFRVEMPVDLFKGASLNMDREYSCL